MAIRGGIHPKVFGANNGRAEAIPSWSFITTFRCIILYVYIYIIYCNSQTPVRGAVNAK